ncbi:MAG: bifunctional phosphopantothenoylcysteine decarboxylase/phosphopantothenate--cysteine ligase CoaBC [Spirochaetota bacterium]|jgi:phosphopantothenoylcysteine decarboxylase/phosphopantothenate--cysteine ligase|nr:bifunctional phosphopantothenoylcysteine decarboxylase/phosphopantothenate--cysteine ligase CoaBC [Spirochaetota bacterium]
MVLAPLKRILLVGSGGIALVKLPALIRMLRRQGYELRLVLTENAARFITPLTFETLLDHPVYIDPFARRDNLLHIGLRKWAEMAVLVPGTANMIAKLAHGIADDLASAVLLGAGGTAIPRIVCPAMNDAMWEAPATRRNIEQLIRDGWRMAGPVTGELACGDDAPGRMAEPEEIFRVIESLSAGDKRAPYKIVITAGATEEDIDAVRCITNHSSGRMGAALAEAARERFMDVVCIHGALRVPPPQGVRLIEARSARAMLQAVQSEIADANALVMAAAVADFVPDVKAAGKIKKSGSGMDLHLVPAPDILLETRALRARAGFHTTGFALESDALAEYAQEKLAAKYLDAIVANPCSEPGAGFGSETNRAVYLTKDGAREDWPTMPKREMADRILDRVLLALSETKK